MAPDPGDDETDGGGSSSPSSSSGSSLADAGNDAATDKPDAGPCELAPECLVDERAVFVRAGAYPETVRVDTTALTLVGGLDCTTWLPPGDGGMAVTHGSGRRGRRRAGRDRRSCPRASDRLRDAAPGTAGASSIAAFVHAGAHLTSVGAQFIAGYGSDGNDAADRAAGAAGGAGDVGIAGAGESTCNVPGGQGGAQNTASTRGEQAAPEPPFRERGCGYRAKASPALMCNQGDAYHATYFRCGGGSDGAAGLGGAADPTLLAVGTASDVGWLPPRGRTGNAGSASGGGGGGGGQANVLGFDREGGGGGAGGCGKGGDGGTGPNEACDGGDGGGGGGGSSGQGGAADAWPASCSGVRRRRRGVGATTAQLDGIVVGVGGTAGAGGDNGDGGAGPQPGTNGVAGVAEAAQSAFRAASVGSPW